MSSSSDSWVDSLGWLRLSLFAFTLLNIAISIVEHQLLSSPGAAEQLTVWTIIALYVTPVMAPLFVVVILFDYVMSRVRAADAEGDESLRFRNIARLELAMILISLLYWVPFFFLLLA